MSCDRGPLATWIAFARAHAALSQALQAALEERHALPLAWHEALVHLEVSAGRLRMQALAERVLLSRSGLTRLCDRMEDAGLIRRESCDGDRRGTYAVMTERGRALLGESCPVFLRCVKNRCDDRLSESEHAVLLKALNRIAGPATGGPA